MTELTLIIDDEPSPHLHRMERSTVIEPGRYWRCTQAATGISAQQEGSSFGFYESYLYLVTRLEYFEGKLHSVVLLNDPALGEQSGILTLELLLSSFEQVDDADATQFRNEQIAAVQGQAADVQKEMAEAQTNPTILQPVIEKGLREWEREVARNRPKGDEAANPGANLPAVTTNGRFDLTAAIGHKIRPADVAVFRHMAQREGKIAEIRGKWLQTKVRELGDVLKKLTPFFAEHAAVGMARAQDALDLAKDVEKGLRSLRLYTGEGVSIETLLEGDSAPADLPLTVYQRKLFMAEEYAVWDDVDRLFDYTNSSEFFRALKSNEALRQQLIPAARGVVAMAIRRNDAKYDAKSVAEALNNESRNQLNKALFLLVRDGENWYQVWSDEPSHELSSRLFPTRNEMEQVFAGIDGETVGFEDLRFTNRASEFDRKSLVYKRFLILACGLDHRLKLFGHFYPDNEALNFISMRFQARYMRFVADDDSDVMLGDNVGSVHDFIRHNHNQLAAGSRVLVFGKELLEQEAAPGAFSRGVYNRHTYKDDYSVLVRPRQKATMLTVHRDKGDLVVYLPVERINDVTYSGYGTARHIKRLQYDVRVALNKLSGDDLGYLLTDIVKAKDLHPFIYSRTTRANSVDYIYGFKLALARLHVEEGASAPAFSTLRERATNHYGLSPAVASTAVMSAVHTWREKTPDATTLPALDAPEFAKLDSELAEAAYAFTHGVPKVCASIEALGGKPVRVMRAKKGMLVVYYEQPEAERDLRVHNWSWAGRRTYTAAGRPTKDPMQTVWLAEGRILGETELLCVPSPLLKKYKERGERDKLLDMLDRTAEMAAILDGAFTSERQGVSDRAWLALTTKPASNRHRDEAPVARNAAVLLPLAVSTNHRAILGIKVKVYDLLYVYGSDAQRAALREKGYQLPVPVRDHNENVVPYEGVPMTLFVDAYGQPEQYTGSVGTEVSTSFNDYAVWDYEYKGERRLDHSLERVFQGKNRKGEKVFDSTFLWIPPQLRADTGEFTVSRLFPGMATA
jgi:hypothetical protein